MASSRIPTKDELEKDFERVFSDQSTSIQGLSSDELYKLVGEILGRAKLVINDQWILGLFGYAGFDVLAFRQKIQALITGEDLTFLCVYFLARGNNIERIIDSSNSEVTIARMKTLAKILDIKKSAKGKNQNVTLSRIAISFPETVSLILHRVPEFPGPVTMDDIRSASDFPEYPAIARQPALACFLPLKDENTQKVLNVFMLPNMMISETINSRNEDWQKKDNKAKFDTTAVYQKNALNSKLFNDDHRMRWCKLYGIVTHDGKSFSAVWLGAAEKAAKSLDKIYGAHF